MKYYFRKMYVNAMYKKESNILRALGNIGQGKKLLDAGCWNGRKTLMWAKAMKTTDIYGVELDGRAARKARKRNIKVYEFDIDKVRWPFKSKFFDCVHSNLLIEHLSNVDHFISETYRVLKRGSYTIVSTNNLSSWHNIFSLVIGWAPFDLANTSRLRWAIGNPLAIHKDEEHDHGETFTHKCVYTIKWLKEWYGLYGFSLEQIYGAGYYPLPALLGNIDKSHSVFITLVFKK